MATLIRGSGVFGDAIYSLLSALGGTVLRECAFRLRGARNGHGQHHGDAPSDGAKPSTEPAGGQTQPEKDTDPVCQMSVDTAKGKTTIYERHLFHFCSQDCLAKFESSPQFYLSTANSASSANEHQRAS